MLGESDFLAADQQGTYLLQAHLWALETELKERSLARSGSALGNRITARLNDRVVDLRQRLGTGSLLSR